SQEIYTFTADDFAASLEVSGTNLLLKDVAGGTLSTVTGYNKTNWDTAYTHSQSTHVGTTGANASGTWGIAISGNAATATKLATARTIAGVSFDGSANISIPYANLSS